MKFFAPIRKFFHYYKLLEVNVYAAYAAYFILLSIFPAVMLLIALLQYTPISAGELEALLKGVVPASLDGLVDYMIKELFAIDSVAVLSFSAITALWMSSKGVYSLQRGLNKVYNQEETRSYFVVRLQCVFFTLLLFMALLLTAFLQVFRSEIVLSLEGKGWALTSFLSRLLTFRLPLTFVLLTLLFTGIYCTFPNKQNERFLDSLPGALVSAALWIGFTRLFTLYVENFGNYSIYYGSLTVIALAMLWLYVCMLILFCGGMLNCAIKVTLKERKKH